MKYRASGRAIGRALVVAGWIAVPGSAMAAGDERVLVSVDPETRISVLTEMRDFLVAIRGIVRDTAAGNAKGAAQAARQVGLSHFAQSSSDPARAVYKVGGTAPDAFRQLAAQVHAGFDRVAEMSEAGADAPKVFAALTENLDRCVACHAAYRFPSIEPDRRTSLPRTVLNPPHAK